MEFDESQNSDIEIESIARDLAIASANNDNNLMVKLGNDLVAKNAIPIEININGNSHEVVYSYKGKVNSVIYSW